MEKKRQKGIVKFFSYKRGYGFLIPEDQSIDEDVVVYLIPNEVLEYDLIKGPRGYLAKNVTCVGNAILTEGISSTKGTVPNLDIYYHYYHSLKKMMYKVIEKEIKKPELNENNTKEQENK
ncbi:hypothetical protein CWI38_0790p0010 [Hamiltosporidium tvaerminnensis]|uniref:Uncharacterized protein n=2 Tax=Hamiltosporidium TaxID=1176354 RepID=A0A4Q9LVF4_9MICR|nr:hypothetical protein CWI36_2218p0010 [Hamiltosporidium magnivora]TBU11125.1 hypothetical protein CWI38_1370p0010 [Hamiltosporidium tvaerminnensis]TBU11263.1 hypothetical protein CWI38_1294p0010 [Hamiltosporidium tvaerminnensis]TBU12357.1 hypothetical protein CWI38_0790p0010 [Hamiltosporidium tvaerminnensis]